MWSLIKEGYEGLVLTVIRPLRAQYATEDLGPRRAQLGDLAVQRTDVKLKNAAGYTLECSWWKPKPSARASEQDKRPCIVVLHGNSSCRLGALELVMYALPAGFTVFALDFSGSGLSQGKYVSLGFHEQADIATCVKYIRKSGDASTINLWGRSMGAVAALLFAQSEPGAISAMVVDSPFSSLPLLATELVEDGKLGVPKIAVKLVMRLIRRDIKKRAKFDMFKLKPITRMNRCAVPAFFVVGLQDELVAPHHVEALHRAHNGPNQLFQFPGGHNSPRPFNFFIQALQFLRVMNGLLPLPADLSTFNLSPRMKSRDSEDGAKKKKRRPKSVRNPLPPGMSIEAVHKMSIKELKDAIARAGYSDVTCIEKKELVDLVLKLYARFRRTNKADGVSEMTADAASRDQSLSGAAAAAASRPTGLMPTTSAAASGAGAAASGGDATSARSPKSPAKLSAQRRRRSDGNLDIPSEVASAGTGNGGEYSPAAYLASVKSSSSSVLSDAEIARGLSLDRTSDCEDVSTRDQREPKGGDSDSEEDGDATAR
jgi:pimeloyl-ACP methyl ester carboxylesterase